MYINIDLFGYSVYGETIGSAWMSLVDAILENGVLSLDEGRKRLCLQNVRIKSETQVFPDIIIDKYGKKENVEAIINLTFSNEKMYDFDIVPSFGPGSQSYYARIKNWEMVNFVVERLGNVPESKKAIMSFIRKEDYERTLKKPKDDYLPCITTIQFRLVKKDNKKGYYLNTNFNARSIDAYQKAGGNFAAISLLTKEVARRLQKKLKTPISAGSLDGMIADAHIYEETIKEAEKIVNLYKINDQNNK